MNVKRFIQPVLLVLCCGQRSSATRVVREYDARVGGMQHFSIVVCILGFILVGALATPDHVFDLSAHVRSVNDAPRHTHGARESGGLDPTSFGVADGRGSSLARSDDTPDSIVSLGVADQNQSALAALLDAFPECAARDEEWGKKSITGCTSRMYRMIAIDRGEDPSVVEWLALRTTVQQNHPRDRWSPESMFVRREDVVDDHPLLIKAYAHAPPRIRLSEGTATSGEGSSADDAHVDTGLETNVQELHALLHASVITSSVSPVHVPMPFAACRCYDLPRNPMGWTLLSARPWIHGVGVGGWIEYYKIGKALFSELETVIGAAAYVLGKMHHSTMEIIEEPEEVLFDREWEGVHSKPDTALLDRIERLQLASIDRQELLEHHKQLREGAVQHTRAVECGVNDNIHGQPTVDAFIVAIDRDLQPTITMLPRTAATLYVTMEGLDWHDPIGAPELDYHILYQSLSEALKEADLLSEDVDDLLRAMTMSYCRGANGLSLTSKLNDLSVCTFPQKRFHDYTQLLAMLEVAARHELESSAQNLLQRYLTTEDDAH